ncbi:hypothetical protein INT47_006524 [Mucor saturninus]|uniref:Uncharacterized protein n=1 Tax=Mucor saturninus TaxID=64648 RepID=A0A8H7QMX4_9FUNG|nr:hypothetical protein INT47_006524 [Mucor saturninus]
MDELNSPQQSSINDNACLLNQETYCFEPKAEDILTDEDLLDLFRIIKQVLRKNPDPEKLAKLLFCMFYALGDYIKFTKPCHEDRILFRDRHLGVHAVRLPSTSSCCSNNNNTIPFYQVQKLLPSLSQSFLPIQSVAEKDSVQKWIESSSRNISTTRLPAVPCPTIPQQDIASSLLDLSNRNNLPATIRSYTNLRPLYNSTPSPSSTVISNGTSGAGSPLNNNRHSTSSPTTSSTAHNLQQQIVETVESKRKDYSDQIVSNTPQFNTPIPQADVVMEPQQRGFYYQDGRILREPASLQRYAEQGILTQASLMRKRKKHSTDSLSEPSFIPLKKPKIPHRHGGFERRRKQLVNVYRNKYLTSIFFFEGDDIINRLREITVEELDQKAQRMPDPFTLAIDQSSISAEDALSASTGSESVKKEKIAELLRPALCILTNHSNMKPHLDNGMNQNGIYYNTDYFRLYLAFKQFQEAFAMLFPDEVVPEEACENENLVANSNCTEKDKDRERNANMKSYRSWIEPLLTKTNWAAFRRNIVVGERIMQLTKSIGQGVLLMTKELSGSKLHLTFTNSEWDEFIQGLNSGKWDSTVEWEDGYDNQIQKDTESQLVASLRKTFATPYWFESSGLMVSSKKRRLAIHESNIPSNNTSLMHRNSVEPSSK